MRQHGVERLRGAEHTGGDLVRQATVRFRQRIHFARQGAVERNAASNGGENGKRRAPRREAGIVQSSIP